MIIVTLSNVSAVFAAPVASDGPTAVVAASYQAMDTAMNAGNVVSHPAAATTQSVSTLLPPASVKVNASASGSALYQYDLARVSDFRAWAAKHSHDFSATNVWSTFQANKVSTQGATSQVLGDETMHIDTTVQDNGQNHTVSPYKTAVVAAFKNTSSYIGIGQTNHGLAIVHHTITLNLVKQAWVIESDQYLDPVEQTLQADHRTPTREASQPSLPAKKLVSQASTSVRYTYSRNAAIKYADKWWNACNPSSNYNCYMGQGVDCANFVSQSIYDQTGGNIPGDDYWYSIAGVGTSTDFVNSPGLYSYMINSPDGSAYNIASNHQTEQTNYAAAAWNDYYYEGPGDVVFYDWAPTNGNQNHVTISVAFDSNLYTYVDSHTSNYYHIFWDFGYNNSSTGFFFVELKNSGIAIY